MIKYSYKSWRLAAETATLVVKVSKETGDKEGLVKLQQTLKRMYKDVPFYKFVDKLCLRLVIRSVEREIAAPSP